MKEERVKKEVKRKGANHLGLIDMDGQKESEQVQDKREIKKQTRRNGWKSNSSLSLDGIEGHQSDQTTCPIRRRGTGGIEQRDPKLHTASTR